MENKTIINYPEIKPLISSLKKTRKSIVLTGGCFDILHIGHIRFLEAAKKNEGALVVLLENDKSVRANKGRNRPCFPQNERAKVLSSIKFVDKIILLPFQTNYSDYNRIISDIKPDYIAVTENDPILDKKKIQAKNSGAKIKVIPYLKTLSSSRIAGLLGLD